MLVVHHLDRSRSHRVLWLLEELGVPYELKTYQRLSNLRAPESLRAIHPLGKSPVVTDGSKVIAESAVILEYLLDTYGRGRLRPTAGTEDFDRYRYFLHYAEGSVMNPLLLKLIFSMMPKQPMPIFVKPVASAIASKVLTTVVDPQLKLHLDFSERELAARPWFAGADFTAADVQMSFPIEAASARTKDFDRTYPRLSDFVARARARDGYRRAEERGGPVTL